jgi:hypothetical protein
MTIDIQIIIDKLTELEHSIYGCGNGRVKVNSFIKKLKQDYEIK